MLLAVLIVKVAMTFRNAVLRHVNKIAYMNVVGEEAVCSMTNVSSGSENLVIATMHRH
jgi:hypothetical protein